MSCELQSSFESLLVSAEMEKVEIELRLVDETFLAFESLYVPHGQRREGRAGRFMKRLAAFADEHGLEVHGEVGHLIDKPQFPDDPDTDQLTAFYSAFGFEFPYGPDDGTMTRPPRENARAVVAPGM